MAWSNSKMFREWPRAVFGGGQTSDVLPAAYAGLGADTVKAALYTTNTPDKDASRITTGYNSAASQWVVANEVSNAGWSAGGLALASKVFDTGTTGVFKFDAADTGGGVGNVTLAAVFGCLIYDDTITVGTGGIADQGVCYNYFGGSQSVTAGTFTVVWNASGIFQITV